MENLINYYMNHEYYNSFSIYLYLSIYVVCFSLLILKIRPKNLFIFDDSKNPKLTFKHILFTFIISLIILFVFFVFFVSSFFPQIYLYMIYILILIGVPIFITYFIIGSMLLTIMIVGAISCIANFIFNNEISNIEK